MLHYNIDKRIFTAVKITCKAKPQSVILFSV